MTGEPTRTPDKVQHAARHSADERPCCTRLVGLGVQLGTTTVLENVNLHIHCGEFTAIIGPNGAGKTTLLRALIGEVRHTGQLVFMPSTGTSEPRRPRVGYVPQRMEIDKTTPLTVLDLFAGVQTRRPVWLRAHAPDARCRRDDIRTCAGRGPARQANWATVVRPTPTGASGARFVACSRTPVARRTAGRHGPSRNAIVLPDRVGTASRNGPFHFARVA